MILPHRYIVLDSFRGLFALFIVIYHMSIINSITELHFFNNSWIFVEFFFVLSGFVLAFSYGHNDTISFKHFLKIRIFRIFPLHIFMLGVFLLLEVCKWFAFKQGVSMGVMPFTGANAVSEIIPNLLLIQAWLPSAETYSFNFPSWSISIEMYTYIIFFLTLFLGKYKAPLWLFISALSLYLLAVEATLLSKEIKQGLCCFFAGNLCYIAVSKLSRFTLSNKVSSLLEILSLIVVILITCNIKQFSQPLIITVFCSSIILFSFEAGIISRILKQKVFVNLGKLSYAIYIVHAAILAIVVYACIILQKLTHITLSPTIDGKRFLDFNHIILNNIAVLVIVCIVIYCANLLHKHIEQPMRLYIRK